MRLDPHLNLAWGWLRETSLSPPVKISYWLFQGGTSFVDLLCYLCLVCHVFVSVHCCLVVTWRPDCRLWCYFMYLFPFWCLGSGVVLDCIDSWSLPTFILSLFLNDMFDSFITLQRCVGKRSLPTAKYNQYVIDNGTDVDAQEDTNGSDIVVCEQCCVGEYCNSAGCRSKRM